MLNYLENCKQEFTMLIRWRLKLWQTKEFTCGPASALLNEPLETMKVLASLPLMWLHHKLEHWGDEENPEYRTAIENITRDEYRMLKERLDQLPANLLNFSNYFGEPRYSQSELREIFSYSEAREFIDICPHMKTLMAYGISLEDFYSSVYRVPMLLDRMYHHHLLHDDLRITLDRELKCVELSNVSAEIDVMKMKSAIEFEIGMGCDEDSQISNGMWRWIYDLLSVRPYFFEGYEALSDGASLVLEKSKHIPKTHYNTEAGEKERLDKLRWETERV